MSSVSTSSQPADPVFQLIRMGPLPWRGWLELTGRDPEAFGAATAGLVYRDKEHHLVLLTPDGAFAGAIGLTVAQVSVGGQELPVVGMGSLIVRRDLRGHGLSARLADAARALAAELGPDRAMLFCDPAVVGLHAARGYAPVQAPVLVDQPRGRVEMPLAAMWRPIRPCEWPEGVVEVVGLPF
jgi:GNAT superfamily N-acetyltransferase